MNLPTHIFNDGNEDSSSWCDVLIVDAGVAGASAFYHLVVGQNNNDVGQQRLRCK